VLELRDVEKLAMQIAEKLSVRLTGTEFVSIDADIPVGAVYQSKFGTVRITAQRSVELPIGPYFSERCADSLAAEIRPGPRDIAIVFVRPATPPSDGTPLTTFRTARGVGVRLVVHADAGGPETGHAYVRYGMVRPAPGA
jgi:hypothetical protein